MNTLNCLSIIVISRILIATSFSFHSKFRVSSTNLFNSNNLGEGENRRRLAEFGNLEPLSQSPTRRERLEQEKRNEDQFEKYGNDLWSLRSRIQDLSIKLLEALSENDRSSEVETRRSLRIAESRDPELVYKIQLEAMIEARQRGHSEDEMSHKEQALNARSCLPQFNLEGLWVGKYGSHGYEMINVTYAGDTLIAFKVTGDKNVPRGEITFQADLTPFGTKSSDRNAKTEHLAPILLTEKAAKKWGTSQLPRYHGRGRVAEEGFHNAQWMEGQLIIIGEEYFSFAWVPIEHQIFFGRPSPELALKMLRDGGVSVLKHKSWNEPPSLDDDVKVWKDFATSCFEKTEEKMEEEMLTEDFGCIWHGVTEECYFE